MEGEMEIKGKITLLINREYTSIAIRDANANTTFCEVILTPQQLNNALSRLGYVDCKLNIGGLDKIGKKHENKIFEFPITVKDRKNNKHLQGIAQSLLDKENEGWIAEDYFNSQDSFFEKEGKQYARVTIRRWI
jgi:hypothetical protein